MNKIVAFILFVSLFSCKHEKVETHPDTGYPEEVSKILVNKCATEGCHTPLSRSTSGGLDFSTWELMFEGGRNGTSVIPYSVDYSYLLYSVNTDTLRGPVLIPTMPYLESHLSDAEYQTLVNWIASGAPDKDGFIKYSDDPSRKKIYVCMQGCDKVAVIDAASKNIMRYVDVGVVPGSIEAPHQVRVSNDGDFWYVVFYSGNVLQKFRTSDDALVATLTIDNITHNWNTIIFTPDGKKGFVNALDGATRIVNLDNMTNDLMLTHSTPHGGFITPDGNFLYLTCQNGNFIYKIDLTTGFYDDEMISLLPGQLPSTSSSVQPHEANLSPDGTKYFVSCQGIAEVRVFQLSNDSLLAVIPVGTKPQEFSFSEVHPYVFLTCTEEVVSSTQRGMVYVINYNNLSVVTTVYSGYQPHGIAVDDEDGLVYVANLNYDPNGSAPHHVSSCGGRNGNLTIFNYHNFQLYTKTLSDGSTFQYKNELLSFPYFVSIRK